MMTTKQLITSSHPKGIDATAKWNAVYNKQKLNDQSAQNLNESKYFWKDLGYLIKEHSAIGKYGKEIVYSGLNYGDRYKPMPLLEQIAFIANTFGLNKENAVEYSKKLNKLPEGAEEWFAIPKISSIAEKKFRSIISYEEQYCEAVKLLLRKSNIANGDNWDESILPDIFRQSSRTRCFFEQLENDQFGDILIIGGQFGLRYRGSSARRANELLKNSENEFGLGAFAVGCMLLGTRRLDTVGNLDCSCFGDIYQPDSIPTFWARNDGLGFEFADNTANHDNGLVSGFLPK